MRWILLAIALLPPFAEARIPVTVLRFALSGTITLPSIGLKRIRCDGWQVDHIVALCAGGLDKRANMQWFNVDDHRFKTYVEIREGRKARQR